MLTVLKLEMHVAYTCNLDCAGCNHYSNYGLKGLVALDQAAQSLHAWSERIQPVHFSLLGGEPLLHPQLGEFLRLGRERFPRTRLRLVTNGLLLPRWPTLWPVLAATRTTLTISIHSREADYARRMATPLALAREASARFGFKLDLRDCVDNWYWSYRGQGMSMVPFTDGDPAASWGACASRYCVTLEDGRLWKCPPLAHLPRVADRLSLADKPAWQPYLRYRPLPLDASDAGLRAFFARGPEPSCGMCPANPAYVRKQVVRQRVPKPERAVAGSH